MPGVGKPLSGAPGRDQPVASGERIARETSRPPPPAPEPEDESSAVLVPIHAMRVIAIGRDDGDPPPPEPEIGEDDIVESDDGDELAAALHAAAFEAPGPEVSRPDTSRSDIPRPGAAATDAPRSAEASDEAVELEPDSLPEGADLRGEAPPPEGDWAGAEPTITVEEEILVDDAGFAGASQTAVTEEEVEALDDLDVAVEPPAPPPPKKNHSKSLPPRPKGRSQVPQPPTTRRRPWWEHLFGDDFARAYRPLTDAQVRRQADFIEKSLGLEAGAVVLDLCCGQGQQAVELAARGYGVVGYDLSVFQLALAAENAQARQLKINFLQGDAREMAFDEMFDAVLCWDTSFGYFEEEKNLNVAERMFKALRPGGVLLLDVLNRDFAAVESPNHVWFEGDGCICMDDVSLDWITSRLRVKRSLILDDGRSREVTYSLRLYSLHELGKLLHDVGFRVTQASGDMTSPGVFMGPCSPRIIVRAQKPVR